MACGGVDYFYQRCGQNMVMTRRGAVGVMLGECGWGRKQSYLGEAQDAGLASGGAGGFSQRCGPRDRVTRKEEAHEAKLGGPMHGRGGWRWLIWFSGRLMG